MFFYAGIFLNNVTNGKLISNTCSDNWIGIYLGNCANILISDNFLARNGYGGIYLTSSYNNTISSNIIWSCNYAGVFISASNENEIYRNAISYNQYGIYLNFAQNSILSENDLFDNTFGMYILYCFNNSFTSFSFVPEPLAIRFIRELSMSSGSSSSRLFMESIMN